MNVYQLKRWAYRWGLKMFKNRAVLGILSFFIKIGLIKPHNSFFNFIVSNVDYRLGNLKVNSYPTSASINLTNICNYLCKFCEIDFFYKYAKEKCGKVSQNFITVDDLKNFAPWLKCLVSLEFSGRTGDSFVNPHLISIIRYLREKYPKLLLSATTNGALIKDEQIDPLIDNKFTRLLFSIHAGTPEVYRYLQGGDFNRIIGIMKKIDRRKKAKGSLYPLFSINFAVNKLNGRTFFNLLDRLKEEDIDIDYISAHYYYDTRNELKRLFDVKDISYHYNQEEGDKLMDEIYAYAKEKNITLRPKQPLYLRTGEAAKYAEAINCAGSQVCRDPWSVVKFNGCVEAEDSTLVSVCNRIFLFRLYYKKFFANGGTLDNIWNHPLMQYFRKTSGKNAICNFCLDPNTPDLRCLDNEQYGARRDQAAKQFYQDFINQYHSFANHEGLEVLTENPYEKM